MAKPHPEKIRPRNIAAEVITEQVLGAAFSGYGPCNRGGGSSGHWCRTGGCGFDRPNRRRRLSSVSFCRAIQLYDHAPGRFLRTGVDVLPAAPYIHHRHTLTLRHIRHEGIRWPVIEPRVPDYLMPGLRRPRHRAKIILTPAITHNLMMRSIRS